MDANFNFLARAKPATIHKLLDPLPLEDAALALASLPTPLCIQAMAYFPEKTQALLLPALREARSAPPGRIAETVEKIHTALKAAKEAQNKAGPPAPLSTPNSDSASASPPARPPAPDARQGKLARAAYGASPKAPPPPSPEQFPPSLAERHDGASPFGKAQAWTPKQAQSSPINGPALPGKPEPVAGDPLQSPLARAGLLDLIGRAQERLLPRTGGAAKRPPASGKTPAGAMPPQPGKIPAGAAKLPLAELLARKKPGTGNTPPGRPPAREGVLRSVQVTGAARVLGPPPGRQAQPHAVPGDKSAGNKPGARRMDGKVILAAIMREADAGVRDNIRAVDPALFKDLQKRMFYFDDLMLTGDNGLAQVFTAAPAGAAALALRFAAPELRKRVLRAVSPGRADVLKDPGRAPESLDDVEAAQKAVLDVALRLQAAGRILIDPRDPDLAG